MPPLHLLQPDQARAIIEALRDDQDFREAFANRDELVERLAGYGLDLSVEELPARLAAPPRGAAEEALRVLDVQAVEPYRPPFRACPFPPPYSAAAHALLLSVYERAAGGESPPESPAE